MQFRNSTRRCFDPPRARNTVLELAAGLGVSILTGSVQVVTL